MADAKRIEEWNHTAGIMAMIANSNRAPNAKLVQPSEFHPYHPSNLGDAGKPMKVPVSALKSIFKL